MFGCTLMNMDVPETAAAEGPAPVPAEIHAQTTPARRRERAERERWEPDLARLDLVAQEVAVG